MPATDEELINGCKAGKRDMQKALYKRFASKMLGVTLRYTRNREEAEDLLQEGFIKVFRSISQYTGPGSFEGWVRRIFVNTALGSLRKAKMKFSDDDVQDLGNDHHQEADVMSSIGMKDLLRMIQGLTPGYQAVFNLYVIEGYQHQEIAKLLEISEGTSKSQLARARMILQEKIKQSMIQKQINKE